MTDSLDYDLYANRLWLPAVLSKAEGPERAIFHHLLSASRIWLMRSNGISPTEAPSVELSEDGLLRIHDEWARAVATFEYGHEVHYRSLRGDPGSCSFGDIARHVMNHGTYHRGQLGALFGAAGLDLPETDFISFAFART